MAIADKLTQIAENEINVYNSGKSKGYTDGFEEGKQAEYDAFWDAFQGNGTRKSYDYAFAWGWDATNFKPKYDLVPTRAVNLFYSSKLKGYELKEVEDRGIKIDFSKSTRCEYLFGGLTELTEIPIDISCESCTGTGSVNGLFAYNPKLETIKKLIVTEDTPIYAGCFTGSPNIKNITFGGVIGKDPDISLLKQLSADSIRSIIEHLSFNVTEQKTLTLSKAAVDKAFETSEGANDGSLSSEWIHWEDYNDLWDELLI